MKQGLVPPDEPSQRDLEHLEGHVKRDGDQMRVSNEKGEKPKHDRRRRVSGRTPISPEVPSPLGRIQLSVEDIRYHREGQTDGEQRKEDPSQQRVHRSLRLTHLRRRLCGVHADFGVSPCVHHQSHHPPAVPEHTPSVKKGVWRERKLLSEIRRGRRRSYPLSAFQDPLSTGGGRRRRGQALLTPSHPILMPPRRPSCPSLTH
mmetsp:Transcript_26308/g.51691  ORF Transcript_26308/g.51691 Transcript_26308/m.51691 type:complete len:203 (-) Transcript_26308:1-609(-)